MLGQYFDFFGAYIINEFRIRFLSLFHVNFIIAYNLIKNVCSRLYSVDV